jgi:hypothetical protein
MYYVEFRVYTYVLYIPHIEIHCTSVSASAFPLFFLGSTLDSDPDSRLPTDRSEIRIGFKQQADFLLIEYCIAYLMVWCLCIAYVDVHINIIQPHRPLSIRRNPLVLLKLLSAQAIRSKWSISTFCDICTYC